MNDMLERAVRGRKEAAAIPSKKKSVHIIFLSLACTCIAVFPEIMIITENSGSSYSYLEIVQDGNFWYGECLSPKASLKAVRANRDP